MKSIKRKVEKKLKRKTNPALVDTIIKTKNNPKWEEVSRLLSRPRRIQIKINLDEIEKNSKEGDKIVVPGVVLGKGELHKKVHLVAFKISESAHEKLKKSKVEFNSISDEIKKNPEAKGIKILK